MLNIYKFNLNCAKLSLFDTNPFNAQLSRFTNILFIYTVHRVSTTWLQVAMDPD